MLAPVLVSWNFGEYVFLSSNLLQTGARKKITGRKNAFLVRLNRVYLLTQFVKCRQNFPGLLDCSQVWKEKGNWIRRRVFSFTPIKRQIRSFHVVMVQWTLKKCAKKWDASSKLLVCPWNSIELLLRRRQGFLPNWVYFRYPWKTIYSWFQFLYLEVSCL